MKRINGSRKWMIAVAVLMFLIMLVCNYLTDMFADDFHYLYSFAAGNERIDSVSDIFPSMEAHARKMNGRLIAHFFAQLFLMLPPAVFDVVNSAMFVAEIYIIYRLANRRGERNLLLFSLIFAAMWLFELAFGQVNFWLVGACNYLWGAVFSLIFLIPYVDKVRYDRDIKGVVWQIAYVIFSFAAGAYTENASAAMLFVAFFLACYAKFVQKRKAKFYHYLAPLSAFAGFIWMMSAPYMRGASNVFSLWNMIVAFGRAGNMFYKMWPVILAFAVLLTIACYRKLPRECIVTAVILVAGGVFAEVIMIFAEYNVERRAFFTMALTLAACAMLFAELFTMEKYKLSLSCVGVCMLMACFYYVFLGVCDIAITHRDVVKNEAYIAQCKADGAMEITLPEVETRSDYSALTGIQYLNPDSTYWLNACMARYYGVDVIHMQEAK